MSEFVLSNGALTALFNTRGAELTSFKNSDGKEYIFRDESVWGYSAPMLFPICGGLKDDKFIYQGKEYILPKHGFCRDAEFAVDSVSNTEITFVLFSDEKTLACYPFEFELRIRYKLEGESLCVDYIVKNNTDGKMYYSTGCHEAYLCPEGIENYTITFDKKETLDSHIVEGNLVSYNTNRIITDSDKLPLKYDYFDIDALVFSKFNSSGVLLESADKSRSIKVDFPGFTQLLLWTPAKKQAPFICIEPWCGMPDMTDSVYDLTKRMGIICLEKGEEKTITHKITLVK